MQLANLTVKELFSQLARGGFLGDPAGHEAYCYIRVSSVQQAEEGRTGLPRQLQHCHEVAAANHLKIPWEMVFADEGFSGFEFENRPALTRLRQEIKDQPKSGYLVIEHIDRLSRNARWHQGFLLEDFAKHKVQLFFWRAFSSEIERAVLGTVAEEGMRSEISRMMAGQKMKAQSGRVTAKRPRFGYRFVDGEGQSSDRARKDTHYALDPDTAPIIKWIYNAIIREHRSLRTIAIEMNENKIPTRFKGKIWCGGTIWRIISDPIYKGDFYANRFYGEATGEFDERGRPRHVMRERPEEEWIKIKVPAIVSPEVWQLAQDILDSNKDRSPRNMTKREWLLSTFIKCEICQYAFVAKRGGSQVNNYPIRYYRCNSNNTERARLSGNICHSPGVRADKIEAFVWSKLEDLVTHPELFLKLVDQNSDDEETIAAQQHLDYLDGQIRDNQTSFERWEKAYAAGVITLPEFKDYRTEYQSRRRELEEAKHKVQDKVDSKASQEEQRRLVIEGLTELRDQIGHQKNHEEVPFEMKRRIVSQLLDTVWVNSVEQTIRFEGVLKSTYQAEDTSFVFGSNPRWR